jgi:LCP family protein required for cell wall assembly
MSPRSGRRRGADYEPEFDDEHDDGYDEYDDDSYDPAPRRSRRQRILLTLGACATVAALLGVGVVGYTYWRLDQIPRYDVDTSEAIDDEPLNYLDVGSDSREAIEASDPDAEGFLDGTTNGSGQRADVIMVMRVYPAGDRLEILSIHRDLWVPIAGADESSRINTAYGGETGAQQLIDTIEANLDIPIHHYAEIDFRGFQDLVEQVGGVPMYFDTPFRDENTGLWVGQAGCMVLDPEQALALVRSRHLEYLDEDGDWVEDLTGDHGRIARQQIFMRNALAQARGKASITNPKEYNDLIGVAIDHVKLDEDVEVTKLAAVAQRFAEFEGDTIETFSLPVEDFRTNGGAAVVRLNEAEAQPILNIFRGDDPDDISPAMADLTILNGSGVKGQAALAEEAYEAIDFEVTDIGDVPGGPIDATTVRYAPGNDVLASLVERHLTDGGVLVEDETLKGFEVVLETGTDFTTVEQAPRPESTTTAPTDDTDGQVSSDTSDDDSDGDDESSSVDAATSTTSTTIIGRTPGEVPDGVECG